MAELKSEETVEIDITTYTINDVPPENSLVVLREKDKLLGVIDLKGLVTDLGRVGSFIRIAYNGIGAAGPKFTDNQIQIQRLGYDITKLCDKSAVTVARFKKTSQTVVTNLQATYGYLLDNLEELAIETLADVSKVASDMQAAALELHKDFERQTEKVVEALEETEKSKGEEALHIIELEEKRVELEEQKKRENEKAMEAAALAKEAEAQRREYELKEDETISQVGKKDVFKGLINTLTSYLGIGNVLKEDDHEAQAAQWKAKRIKALESLNKAQQEKSKALDNMASFAAKITNSKTESNMADAAVNALHEAIGALKQLSAVMMQAALFWKQMEDHCRSLSEDGMKNVIARALKYPEDKRLKVWTSRGFKVRALEFYAGWVALHGVCTIYIEQIKIVQKDLYKYIQENPTYEESKANVKMLAATFLEDLKKDQQAISDKEFAAQEEIKSLTAENKAEAKKAAGTDAKQGQDQKA